MTNNPTSREVNLFRHLPNGAAVTERVLFTLLIHWGVKTFFRDEETIIVEHPYSREHPELSGVLFSLCDNGGEVNVEPINQPERLKSKFPAGLCSVPSISSAFALTAETMAWRIWRTMTGQPIDWNKNDTPCAQPDTEPMRMIGGW